MKRSAIIWFIVVVIAVIAGFWYWSSAGPGTTGNESVVTQPTSTTSMPVPSAGTMVLGTATSSGLGTYLVASNGMTLYKFIKDQAGTSTCNGQCAALWPPYASPTNATGPLLGSSAGVIGQIGSIMRADGTSQITYDNLPLYYYSKDQTVGDAKGQNFAGLWSVVKLSSSASSSNNISGPGARCGGNMVNPPSCTTGYHCAPNPSSTLPFGDVGGTCVANSSTSSQ